MKNQRLVCAMLIFIGIMAIGIHADAAEVGLRPGFDAPNDAVVYSIGIDGGSGLTVEAADPFGLTDTIILRGVQSSPVRDRDREEVTFEGYGGCYVPFADWVTDSSNVLDFPDFTGGWLIVRTIDAGGGFPKDHIVKLISLGTAINVRVVRGINGCVLDKSGVVEGPSGTCDSRALGLEIER